MPKQTKQKISPTKFYTNKLFLIVSSVTLIFCSIIAFDLIPQLRGPAPYPPEWQWGYYFVNTLSRIFLPISSIIFIGILISTEETFAIFSKRKLLIPTIILLGFLFQLSVLYYSRAGITVLVHRIIDPGLNSYFTAGLTIKNIPSLLHQYTQHMIHFTGHAQTHPPGSVLFFYLLNQLFSSIPPLGNFANQFSPSHGDILAFWKELKPAEKTTALFSSLFIPFLACLGAVPMYYAAKRLSDHKTALRSALLFLLIPGIIFFIPINDAFLPLFSVSAFYFLVKGIQDNQQTSFFLSGLILFTGVFFNLAFLPLSLFFFLYTIFSYRSKKKKTAAYLQGGGGFALGFFLPFVLLFILFQFNFLEMAQTIFRVAPHEHIRSYTLWLPFNLLDFFIFAGIPATVVFFILLKQTLTTILRKHWGKTNFLFIAFTTMLILLDLSGTTRGETGRIWALYMPFLLLITVEYLTKQAKFSTKFFIGIILLQALQILVMQEYWVMLW